jgi:hypothetical protein
MTTIGDVRRVLWEAYEKWASTVDIYGKSAEGTCSLIYPTYWESEELADFSEPIGLEVYSYALGPNREHYFMKAEKEDHPESDVWESPDFMGKAVEVIKGWMENI